MARIPETLIERLKAEIPLERVESQTSVEAICSTLRTTES